MTIKRLTHIIGTAALILPAVVAMLPVQSCHRIEPYDNSVKGNFDQLWTLFDQHYCFFKEKGVDWDAAYAQYAPKAANCRTQQQLFDVCGQMLELLQDGHVNLSSSFDTYYYRAWWNGYPQNFNLRVIQQNYLYFGYKTIGTTIYARLPQNVGYVYIPDFGTGIGDGNIDNILNYFALCDGIIIDVRNNGGGALTNAQRWIEHFITAPTFVGTVKHKNGPGHNDFSKPFALTYNPAQGHVIWGKPVVLLTNRSTFSAANNFAAIMRLLDNVTVVGAHTGGGAGIPLSYELAVGWGVRMSAAPVYDAQGVCTEWGVDPTPGFAVDMTDADIASGRDPILERAVSIFSTISTQ